MFSATLAMILLMTPAGFTFGSESVCSCLSRVPSDASVRRKVKHERGESKALFSGQVIEVTERSTNGSLENVVSFKVLQSWKRVETGTIKVVTPRPTSASCGYDFRVGESYLVYVQRDDDAELWTGICSRTTELARAVEDLRVLGKGRRFPDISKPIRQTRSLTKPCS